MSVFELVSWEMVDDQVCLKKLCFESVTYFHCAKRANKYIALTLSINCVGFHNNTNALMLSIHFYIANVSVTSSRKLLPYNFLEARFGFQRDSSFPG